VFEVISNNTKLKTSILGGGRYDQLVSKISNDRKNFSAIGFAIGIERLLQVINEKKIYFQAYEKQILDILFFVDSEKIY
jgi:histidyl-tRNA synthetase